MKVDRLYRELVFCQGTTVLVIDIILPVFCLIFLGYSLARCHIIDSAVSRGLVNYVFWAAAPAIIFLSICTYHDMHAIDQRFWIAYGLSIAVLSCITYLFFKTVWQEKKTVAIIQAFSITIKNTVIIGFPILAQITGPRAAIPMAATVIVVNCIVAPFLMLMLELADHSQPIKKHRLLLASLRKMLTNPLVLSAFLGVLLSIWHVSLSTPIQQTLTFLGNSFVPCALFAVGVDLKGFKLNENAYKTIVITLINLLVCPLLAIALCFLLKLSAFYSVALVIFSAMPTAKTMYIYISKYRIFEQEMSMIISLTTVVSFVTIPVVIVACSYLWPSVFHGHNA